LKLKNQNLETIFTNIPQGLGILTYCHILLLVYDLMNPTEVRLFIHVPKENRLHELQAEAIIVGYDSQSQS